MIYLGEKVFSLTEYSKEVICWLSIKIKGRAVYNCGISSCSFCNGNGKKRKGLDQEFRDLFTNNIIEQIIKGKPHTIFDLVNRLQIRYTSIPGKTVFDFKRFCKELFLDSGYTNWFLKEKKNYKLANLLNQHTCTYCNREYIFVYKNKAGGKGMVPQFDHWFSQTDYPLLALSFYNLIPSCGTCNTIKSAAKFNLNDYLNPYSDKNISSTYSFGYLPTGVNTNKIILRKEGLNSKGIDTVKALNLPLIYKGHSEKELQDLIDLRYKYSENYLNILLHKTFGDLKISEKERFRLIFGIEIDEDNYHKRPLSKFKRDILKELKVIS